MPSPAATAIATDNPPRGFQWSSYPASPSGSGPETPQDPAAPTAPKPKRGRVVALAAGAGLVAATALGIAGQPDPFVDEQPVLAAQIESAAAGLPDAADQLQAALEAAYAPSTATAALTQSAPAALGAEAALAELPLLEAAAAAVLDPDVTALGDTTEAELRGSWNEARFADLWEGGLAGVTAWRITAADGEALLAAIRAAVDAVPGHLAALEEALGTAEADALSKAVASHGDAVTSLNTLLGQADTLLAEAEGRVADTGTRTKLASAIADARSLLTEQVPGLSGDVTALEKRVSNAKSSLNSAMTGVTASTAQWEADQEAARVAEEEAARAAEEAAAAQAAAEAAAAAQAAQQAQQTSSASAYYANCTEARAAGAAPIYRGEPGYRSALDRDNDGIACE